MAEQPVRYAGGYHLHPIHARRVGHDQENWSLVTVADSRDGTLIVRYDDGHTARLVRYLPGGVPPIPPGVVVRLNNRWRVLDHPTASWLSVHITTPHPSPTTLPSREMTTRPVIVEVTTGIGFPCKPPIDP